MMSATELCMHDLDSSTCSVCKYTNMPSVHVFGRSAHYHTDADCDALRAEREGVKKRGGILAPVALARPGTTALDGRTACAVCA